MAISVFRLPDLGEGLTEADVVEWYVAEGERVALDQPVVALESAKAVVDIPSPVAGRVRRHCARPGESVATGAPLVEFDVDAQAAGSVAEASPAAAVTTSEADAGAAASAPKDGPDGLPAPVQSDEPPTQARSKENPSSIGFPGTSTPGGAVGAPSQAGAENVQAPGRPSAPRSSAGPDRINAMPAARAAARALGVDLASVTGTGPGGRIRVADVERASNQAGRMVGETLRGVRKTMAERMALSHARVVPVTVTEDADIGDWREGEDVTVRLNPCRGRRLRGVTVPQRMVRQRRDAPDPAPGRPCRHRRRYRGRALRPGTARRRRATAAARRGRSAPRRGHRPFACPRGARRGNDHAEQHRDGRRAVWHPGRGPPPQVAILGAGRAREEPVVRGGTIAIRRRMPLSLTFDHRACTGAESSRFLAAVVADLEQGT